MRQGLGCCIFYRQQEGALTLRDPLGWVTVMSVHVAAALLMTKGPQAEGVCNPAGLSANIIIISNIILSKDSLKKIKELVAFGEHGFSKTLLCID